MEFNSLVSTKQVSPTCNKVLYLHPNDLWSIPAWLWLFIRVYTCIFTRYPHRHVFIHVLLCGEWQLLSRKVITINVHLRWGTLSKIQEHQWRVYIMCMWCVSSSSTIQCNSHVHCAFWQMPLQEFPMWPHFTSLPFT